MEITRDTELTTELLKELKAEYKKLYKTVLDGDVYIWHKLSRKDYKKIMKDYEDTRESLSTIKVKLNENGKEITSNNAHQPIWSQGSFDIDILCGEYETASGGPVHIILKDCYITDCRSMRNKDGGVAEELYSFIARDFKTIG